MIDAMILAVPCPQCMVAPTVPCVTVSGTRMYDVHTLRLKAAAADPALPALADRTAQLGDSWTAAIEQFGGGA